MKKSIKVLVTVIVVVLVTLVIWSVVGEEDNFAKDILSCIEAVVFVVVGLVGSSLFTALTNQGGTGHMHKLYDSGLISCKKCGHIGAGHGFCPRCGWNRTEKITSRSSMISCMKCGYLGVGYGNCPRCGWTRIQKITR